MKHYRITLINGNVMFYHGQDIDWTNTMFGIKEIELLS